MRSKLSSICYFFKYCKHVNSFSKQWKNSQMLFLTPVVFFQYEITYNETRVMYEFILKIQLHEFFISYHRLTQAPTSIDIYYNKYSYWWPWGWARSRSVLEINEDKISFNIMFYVISMLISDFPYVECSNRALFYSTVLDKYKFIVN